MEATKSATLVTKNIIGTVFNNLFGQLKEQILGSIHIPQYILWIICAIPVVLILLFALWFWWNFLR